MKRNSSIGKGRGYQEAVVGSFPGAVRGVLTARLMTEELTGQTDSEARAQRQRFFQEVFLQGENPTSQGVDMLSVTH